MTYNLQHTHLGSKSIILITDVFDFLLIVPPVLVFHVNIGLFY